MRTIVYRRYGPPEVLHFKEVETPTPAENEVLIQIQAVAVTATDVAFRSGKPFVARLFAGPRKPRLQTLGGSLAGEVVAIGADVTRFKIGERVFGVSGPSLGGYAEFISLAEDGALAKMPDGMTYVEAAGIADGGPTALPFVRDKGKVEQGQKVLINGAAGAIGTMAVQLAKHYGAHVTGVCSGPNADLVKSLGADEVIDYSSEDFTLRRGTYDIIFDTIGKSSFSKAKGALTRRGKYLTTVPTLGGMLTMMLAPIFSGKRGIFAATGLRKPADKARDLAFMGDLFAAGTLHVVVDRSYPFDQFADAHKHVDTGHKKGVVVLTIQANPA